MEMELSNVCISAMGAKPAIQCAEDLTSEGHLKGSIILEYRSGLQSGNDGARGLLAHTNT